MNSYFSHNFYVKKKKKLGANNGRKVVKKVLGYHLRFVSSIKEIAALGHRIGDMGKAPYEEEKKERARDGTI